MDEPTPGDVQQIHPPDEALGQEVELSAQDIRVLERWMAKTAMVLESGDVGRKAFSLGQAKDLMDGEDGNVAPWGFVGLPIHAVAPNRAWMMRTWFESFILPGHDCTGHNWRVTTINLGEVRFVTAHAADREAFKALQRASLSSLLGPSVSAANPPWRLDRTSPIAPDHLEAKRVEISHRS